MAWSLGKSLKRDTTIRRRSHARSVSHEAEEHDESHAEHPKHKPLPFLASPVDPEAMKWVARKKRSGKDLERSATTSAAQFEAERTESQLAKRIFRKQHEASSLELFFDLFFVANLAVFTTRSAHMDLQSLSNYMGFFAILWTTWFHSSMYDVRFYVDSVFTRICKFAIFGVMVSLVSLGSLYDAVLFKTSSRAFHGVAILMFAVRLLWILQYAVVLYFVRVFDKTLVPMCLTMAVYLVAACVFLATWIKDKQSSLAVSSTSGIPEVRIWYGVICIEAVAVILIAVIWRVLSFMHTHLVERVGLLSLIIMGEGIIGLVKSTSYTIQGTNISIWQESLIIGAAVLLIYLIYILYFDNIDHHGFGTIGQQFWTLLHFPLHVAILLTVEGSTALLIWNACRKGVDYVNTLLPSLTNPKGNFNDNKAFVAHVAASYNATMDRFKYKPLTDYYKYDAFQTDLSKLSKTNATFGSSDWSKEVGKTLEKMSNYYQYFIYQNFGAEGPVAKLKKTTDYGVRVSLYEEGYRFVLIYYYISAGALLLIMAGLLLFGKKHKTGTNWWSIAIRIFSGLCIPLGIISPLMEKAGADNSFRYRFPFLLIPIVSIGYFLVVIVDNIAKAISEKHYTLVEERRLSRITSTDPSMAATIKKMTTVEEERELTDEESSYEMHRSSGVQLKEHGSPQFVGDNDHAGLIQHAQPQPTSGGYTQVGQEDADLGYRYGDEQQPYRRFDQV